MVVFCFFPVKVISLLGEKNGTARMTLNKRKVNNGEIRLYPHRLYKVGRFEWYELVFPSDSNTLISSVVNNNWERSIFKHLYIISRLIKWKESALQGRYIHFLNTTCVNF